MKKCVKCNLSYDEDKSFCKKCGSPLTSEYQIEPKEVAKKSVFEDRLRADPLNIALLHEYAQFLFNNLIFKETIMVSLKILAIKEEDGVAKELLFKSYLKLNMLKETLGIGKQLLLERPTDTFLLQELAEIAEKLGNSDKATEYYNMILSLQPTNTSALYNKAQNFLEKNQLEPAIEIFKNLHLEGQNDRITIIYAGVGKAFAGDYKAVVKLLTPILSDENLDTNDINNNRGILYLTYSLSQNAAGLSEILPLLSKVNQGILKKNHHHLDEQTYVKIIECIVNQSLNDITPSASAHHQFLKLTDTHLASVYFTANSNSKISELWYAVGNKQADLKLFSDALNSFQKARDLMPSENKYKTKSSEVERILTELVRNRKRKTFFTLGVAAIVILMITVSTIVYKNYSDKKAWEIANKTNTIESFQEYLNGYPNGIFLKEAKLFLEKYGVIDMDGNIYHTITIGTQVWMVENLKTTKYNDGTSIPNVISDAEWKQRETPGYCWFDNDIRNKNPWGALYNWHTVNTGKLAPKGWHVPSYDEWTTLIIFLGGESVAGGKLKEDGRVHWRIQNSGPNNESGFTALPGGYRKYYKDELDNTMFFNRHTTGLWWSSTQKNKGEAYYRDIWAENSYVSFNGHVISQPVQQKSFGYSVRCIKDNNGSPASEIKLNIDNSDKVKLEKPEGEIDGTKSSNIEIKKSTPTIDKTSTIKDIEGNVYHIITFGTQAWLVENLKTTKLNDGTLIPNVISDNEWKTLKTPGFRWYNNDTSNKNIYGALYNWYTINSGKLAPKGWHVPSDDEWSTLTKYIQANLGDAVGRSLGAKTGWKTDNNNDPYSASFDLTKNNTSGFTALPGGCFAIREGGFGRLGEGAFWWSSTEINSQCAWTWYLLNSDSKVTRDNDILKDYGLSVRCVKD
jgi:uncharacterized protein (TIGR02145 family)